MDVTDLDMALGEARAAFPPQRNGTRPPAYTPWPVLVRLPDGTVCEIVAVRPGPLEVVLDAEPRRG